MSLLNLCYMLGIALALPVGGIVNDLSHVKWASLLLSAVLFAAVSLSSWRLAPGAPPSHAVTEVEGGEFNLIEFLASMKQIPAYLILAVVTFTGIGFPMPIIKLFASDEFGMSESSFGGLVFPAAILMAALSVPMSKLGERIGRARAVHVGLGLCSIGLAVIASGAFVPPLRHPWVMAVGGMPVGIGFLLTIPAWMASVSDIDPSKRAANLGAVMTAQGLGAIIGASFGGLLYETLQPVGMKLHLGPDFGRYMPFVGCAAAVTLGWLVSLRILHPQERPAPAEYPPQP